MQYKPSGRDSGKRIVDPLGLVAKGNAWYLVANTPNGFRTYRVSRMEEARLLDQACERPPDFDLAAYWQSSTKEFQDGWHRHFAILRVDPHAAEWMKTWQSTSQIETSDRDPEGWIRLRVQFDHENEACFVVLGLGSRVEVIEPASLRERIADEARKVVERGSKGQTQLGITQP
jgi:predicted DNA-binding transcriptional regulator YafY